MATLKELQNKIASLQKTYKITSAMKLIATTKFNRSLVYITRMKNYRSALLELSESLANLLAEERHPLTEKRPEKHARWIVITSERGLCGAFNSNVNRRVLQAAVREECDFSVDFYGKKGEAFFVAQQKSGNVQIKHSELKTIPLLLAEEKKEKMPEDLPSLAQIRHIAKRATADFLEKKVDRINLAYNYFESTISQKPVVETLLPFTPPKNRESGKASEASVTIFEPERKKIIAVLLEKSIHYQLYFAMLSSAVGEHAARMTAMDNASKNCEELIDEYTLMRNRARQAAITTELVEIISGSESLNA